MGHTSGLSGFEPAIDPTTLYDWGRCVEILAAMEPWWEPGTQAGYHAITHGYLQGEIVRRVDGRTLGTFFREEVAEPLGADFHIGFGPELDHRCGELIPPGERAVVDANPGEIAARTGRSCPLDATEPRTRAWRAAEIPAAGGFGNARSVGRVHSALACGGTVDGVTLMSADTVARISEEQFTGVDLVLAGDLPLRHGLGFGLPSERTPFPSPGSFFWGGWGGSLALIDPANQLTVSYVMNRMAPSLQGDMRGGGLAFRASCVVDSGTPAVTAPRRRQGRGGSRLRLAPCSPRPPCPRCGGALPASGWRSRGAPPCARRPRHTCVKP